MRCDDRPLVRGNRMSTEPDGIQQSVWIDGVGREGPAEPVIVSVILAAGRSTRYRGPEPTKLLADVGGRPAVCRVVDALESGLGGQRQIVVTGWQAEAVESAIGPAPHRTFVRQSELRGTGHALAVAMTAIPAGYPAEYVMVAAGDKPLLSAETIAAMQQRRQSSRRYVIALAADLPYEAGSQGRVMMETPWATVGALPRIVEPADIGRHSPPARALIEERRRVNCSCYAWSANGLRRMLEVSSPDRLTDLVNEAPSAEAWVLPADRWQESLGVDTVNDLQEVRRWLPVETGSVST